MQENWGVCEDVAECSRCMRLVGYNCLQMTQAHTDIKYLVPGTALKFPLRPDEEEFSNFFSWYYSAFCWPFRLDLVACLARVGLKVPVAGTAV